MSSLHSPTATAPPPGPPDSFISTDDTQSSLLRTFRRHSLPAPVALLSFWPSSPTTPISHQSSETSRPQTAAETREAAAKRGHRHTRSDAPVLVKTNYPPPQQRKRRVGGALGFGLGGELVLEEELDVGDPGLPSIEEFSFDGVLKAVDPQVTKAIDAITELCTYYQSSVRTEIHALTDRQTDLDDRIRSADQLSVRVLKATKTRVGSLDSESSGLHNGKAVDALAEATESTHALLTSITSTLLLIDEMLPPQDRLSPDKSPHRRHYPRLHNLLNQKAAELNLMFPSKSGTPASRTLPPHFRPSTSSAPKPDSDMTLQQRRRLSSASALRYSTYCTNPPTPTLQLKTILPGRNAPAQASSDSFSSSEASYLPLAPRTATSLSLTTAPQEPPTPRDRRPSDLWTARRPATAAWAGEGGSSIAGIADGDWAQQQQKKQRGMSWNFGSASRSWRSSGGGWSGWFGSGSGSVMAGSSSRQSIGGAGEEGAQEALVRVLQQSGKGKAPVRGSGW